MQRYSTYPFPGKRYITGQGLHPKNDPDGFQVPAFLSSGGFDEISWQNSTAYRYAVDLFNNGFWWETHETLEALWNEVGKKTSTGIFIKGLIQISAALLKKLQKPDEVNFSIADKGFQKAQSKSGIFIGLDVDLFLKNVRAFLSGQCSEPPVIKLIGAEPAQGKNI
ncbi:MAG: DUF309 domain-containing protein [Desulfobacterales bacterium]|nr:DUF309 domain-containing protein [Desulfobacterales bacterium]